jgi:S-adenosylmethionine:diacylglycerol 3-amino-3-carboxypropyl transferase
MKNKHENKPALQKQQGKGTEHTNQIKTIFQYLETHTATASMVSKATGVPQKNICRFKRDMEKAGTLAEIKKDTCQLTGFKAWYLTTNKNLFPQRQQLKLF